MNANEFCLRLVGGQTLLVNDDLDSMLCFYGSLFKRLKSEVSHTGRISRYLCFRRKLDESRCFHGLFIEVTEIDKIPNEMVAWELDRGSFVVIGDKNKKSSTQLNWLWLKNLVTDNRLVGEFSASLPPDYGSSGLFMLSGCAYIDLQAPVDDGIELVEYDPSWPEKYHGAAAWLQKLLPESVLSRIEHYGSTSIPGMPAKPIIDILVEIPSFELAKQEILPLLVNEACEYWWDSEHMIFIRRTGLNGKRTHHIHLATPGHKLWEGLAFRDYLRSHHEAADDYAGLKLKLADRYCHDRERYTKAKAEFIMDINAKTAKINRHNSD